MAKKKVVPLPKAVFVKQGERDKDDTDSPYLFVERAPLDHAHLDYGNRNKKHIVIVGEYKLVRTMTVTVAAEVSEGVPA